MILGLLYSFNQQLSIDPIQGSVISILVMCISDQFIVFQMMFNCPASAHSIILTTLLVISGISTASLFFSQNLALTCMSTRYNLLYAL